ncbi:MAG TPA: prephenate dehydrogenase, partial [bacterium]|nr:prephenate dehydrogenase [bacterium]
MPFFKAAGIVGLGMLGGSLALDMRRLALAEVIIGASRRRSTLAQARKWGVVDEVTTDISGLIGKVDFLILATPPSVVPIYLKLMARFKPDLLATDVASVKKVIMGQAEKFLRKPHFFVGSHPIAGSEQSGLKAARENLFTGRTVVVTPSANNPPKAVNRVIDFWYALGARTVRMTPEEHDFFLALTSHLPHLVAYALVEATSVLKRPAPDYCLGSGFRDTTRIAKSNPS